MSTDHTSDRPRPLAGPSEELDPWSEFLSESDELSARERSAEPRADTAALGLVDRAEPGGSTDGEFSSELTADLPPVSPSVLSSDLFRPDTYSRFEHKAADAADVELPASSRDRLPLPVTLSLAIPSRPAPEPDVQPEPESEPSAAYVRPPVLTDASNPPGLEPTERPAASPGRADRTSAPTGADPASGSIAVRDLLSRQTPVQWAEAVAVVEALCEVLVRRGTDRVPDSRDILITADGGVDVRPGAGGETAPAVLGQLLNALLTTASTPLPLRLFVTSSSASGRYRSIALYADALSYYAVPGRAEAIATLYRRALTREPAAPPRAPAVPAAAKPAAAAAGTTSRAARVPSWLVAAVVGVVAGVSIGAVLIMRMPSGSGAATPATAVAVESATSGARDNWELGAIDPGIPGVPRRAAPLSVAPPSTPTSTRTSTSTSTSTSSSSSLSGAVSPSLAPSAPSEVLPAAAPPPPPPSPPAALVASTSIPEPTRPPSVAPGPVLRSQGAALPAIVTPRVSSTPVRRPPPPEPHVYSAGDSDVEPPVMLSPAPLAPPPPSPTDTFANSTVELIVDSTGSVQKASLLERPTRLPDVTNLQAYKTLKFSPATKDGQPVSYRYVLRIVAAPR